MVVAVAALVVPVLIFVGASVITYREIEQQAEERILRTLELLYNNVRTTFESEYLVAANVQLLEDYATNADIRASWASRPAFPALRSAHGRPNSPADPGRPKSTQAEAIRAKSIPADPAPTAPPKPAPPNSPPPEPPPPKLPPYWHRVAFIVGTIVVLFGAWQLFTSIIAYTDDAYVRSDLIAIAPEVTGRIIAVHVADNQEVKIGDKLLSIDPEPFILAVNQAGPTSPKRRRGRGGAGRACHCAGDARAVDFRPTYAAQTQAGSWIWPHQQCATGRTRQGQ